MANDTLKQRFIPAYTGNAAAKSDTHFMLSVYPRVYGECLSTTHQPTLATGLSPRIRGMRDNNRPQKVYPRVYGECALLQCHPPECYGLSPRIRGMLSPPFTSELFQRFIPAYTGNAAGRLWQWWPVAYTGNAADAGVINALAVYPRVYGECAPCA